MIEKSTLFILLAFLYSAIYGCAGGCLLPPVGWVICTLLVVNACEKRKKALLLSIICYFVGLLMYMTVSLQWIPIALAPIVIGNLVFICFLVFLITRKKTIIEYILLSIVGGAMLGFIISGIWSAVIFLPDMYIIFGIFYGILFAIEGSPFLLGFVWLMKYLKEKKYLFAVVLTVGVCFGIYMGPLMTSRL